MSFSINGSGILGHTALLFYKGYHIAMTTMSATPELHIYYEAEVVTGFEHRGVSVEAIAAAAAYIDTLPVVKPYSSVSKAPVWNLSLSDNEGCKDGRIHFYKNETWHMALTIAVMEFFLSIVEPSETAEVHVPFTSSQTGELLTIPMDDINTVILEYKKEFV